MRRERFVVLCGILTVAAACAWSRTLSAIVAAAGSQASAEAEGFKVSYKPVTTPKSEWGTEREEEWLTSFQGTLMSEKPISYRGLVLKAGQHDVWIEKGKGEWFQFLVGDRDDEEAPRLRSLFKLYEMESGVDALRFELKLTRNSSKLKFSVFAGSSEGHSNFRVETPGGDAGSSERR